MIAIICIVNVICFLPLASLPKILLDIFLVDVFVIHAMVFVELAHSFYCGLESAKLLVHLHAFWRAISFDIRIRGVGLFEKVLTHDIILPLSSRSCDWARCRSWRF